jgi:long-subunit fatty acid transport protein
MRKLFLFLPAMAVIIYMAPGMAFGASADLGFPTPGERAQAMGNAFVAVANDASAIYWNPAGMALIKDRQAQISHSDLYGLGIDYNYIAYAQSMYGIAWAHIDADEFLMGGGDYSQDMYIIAGARKIDPQTYAGVNIKWHQMRYVPPSGYDGHVSSTDGFSLDLGALYVVDESTTIGAKVADLFGELKTKNSDSDSPSTGLEPNISIGFSRKTDDNSLYSIEIDNLGKEASVHFGLEKRLQKELVLRAGVDDEVITAGFGFFRDAWEINYSYKNKTSLGLDRTQRFGALIHF